MKRSTFKTIAMVTSLTALTSQSLAVAACGGGGGYRGGFSGGYSQPAVSYAPASTGYPQPSLAPSRHAYPSSASAPSQFSNVQHPVLSVAPAQRPSRTQTASAQQTSPSITANQSVPNQLTAQPSEPSEPPQTSGNSSQTSTPPAQTESESPKSPEVSALQMLASITTASAASSENPTSPSDEPQFASATISEPEHVGNWTATLPNQATIQLQLDADGKFSWSATRNGKTSTFAGDYRVDSGRLTLVRDGDRQQLKGAWIGDLQSGFKFKLDGSKDSGLDFQRS